MKNRFLPIIILLAVCGALFYVYGRSLWNPVLVKITGGTTVTEVVESLKEKGKNDFDPERWSRLVILGLKEERVLEVWGVDAGARSKKIAEFSFTGYSGSLGPKLKEGDGQIPEGIYRIEYLNPNSSYHLSMKLDYPNAYDRRRGKEDGRENLGSDIFIHGRSATIGCIPIGDEGIEDLFLMVAKIGKDNVDVVLSPYDMRKHERDIQIPGIDWEQGLYSLIAKSIDEKIPQPTGGGKVVSGRATP